MTTTLNEKLIAYLTLISGLSISAVAVYYSVVGLTAIFAAAVIPIIIMGVVLELSKLVATVWLKQNWGIAPWPIRVYLLAAILILMLITSMGIFGLLSKAHSDQGLVSGDVQAKLAFIDEKIKTAKDNIDVNRKAIKQLDDAVDQVMGRSSSESGADKAVALRRSQSKERSRLAAEIAADQKTISLLNEEAAPIRAQVRQVEAEVGPIKYIASLIYDQTDHTMLERAVVWVIILIVVVFDPLAVALLLASQISFQNFRQRREENKPDPWIADVGEKPTEDELKDIEEIKYEPDDGPLTENQLNQIKETANNTQTQKSVFDLYPYLNKNWVGFGSLEPMVYIPQKNEPIEDSKLPNNQDIEKARELRNLLKDHGFSSQEGIVKINGQSYSVDEFDRLMNIPIEEFIIDQNEYFNIIKSKQSN